MADNDARDNRRNGHNQIVVGESDELLVCIGCDGRGRHCDQWGPWDCGLCHGLGYVTRGFWNAWVASFPPFIQTHIRNQPEPLVHQGDGRVKKASWPATSYK